jgi:hypothetical protein
LDFGIGFSFGIGLFNSTDSEAPSLLRGEQGSDQGTVAALQAEAQPAFQTAEQAILHSTKETKDRSTASTVDRERRSEGMQPFIININFFLLQFYFIYFHCVKSVVVLLSSPSVLTPQARVDRVRALLNIASSSDWHSVPMQHVLAADKAMKPAIRLFGSLCAMLQVHECFFISLLFRFSFLCVIGFIILLCFFFFFN